MWQVRGQKENKMKKKKKKLLHFGLKFGNGGEKQILERESVQVLSRFSDVRTVGSQRAKR